MNIYIYINSLYIYVYKITYSTSSLFEQHLDVDNLLISSSFSLDMYPEVGFLDDIVILFSF